MIETIDMDEWVDARPKGIRFVITVDPLLNRDSQFHCDFMIQESDLRMVDEHGIAMFMERYVAPALYALLEKFVQPHSDIEDLMKKVEANGGTLPRSVEFYRQRYEAEKVRKAEA